MKTTHTHQQNDMGKNMKSMLTLLLTAILAVASSTAAATRQDIPINDGWTVRPMAAPQRTVVPDTVTLPHTWNSKYTSGTSYNRETMVYERNLAVSKAMLDGKHRLFLLFEGVNSVANVFINRRSAATHKGGYTAFCVEITGLVNAGDNLLEVWAGNAYRTDVLPISGDFNVQGGIHRPVHLIVTPTDCIAPDFYGSSGVQIRQKSVTKAGATVGITAVLGLRDKAARYQIKATVADGKGKTVAAQTSETGLQDASGAQHSTMTVQLDIKKPHLWDGLRDPYLYSVDVELLKDGVPIDKVRQPLGLRSFSVDPDRGFTLNGRPYDLHGFNRHDDFKGVGSALTAKEYRRDMQLISAAGATAMRLAHYPHGETIYNLCDTAGVILWSEIPFCGPGGYFFTGYVSDVSDNARLAMREMVYQKMNHPSVMFWGLFNELLIDDGKRFKQYDDPRPLLRELNDVAHSIDPTRLTCFATCVDEREYLGVSDLIAWNKYFSWKGAERSAIDFFTKAKADAGGQPVGVSEYGRGGSPRQHGEPAMYRQDKFESSYHPEEYQAICHENYWKAFRQMPWLWLKTVWQFSDMMSSIKNEGDTPGQNDKGLVTYDRQTLKDAYYFYQANWNTMPEARPDRPAVLHLCSKNFTSRKHADTRIKVYTTLPQATLYLNGAEISTLPSDSIHKIEWSARLSKGKNTVRVVGKGGLEDSAEWVLE